MTAQSDLARVMDTLNTAKLYKMSIEELMHAGAFAESVEEWQRVVNDLAVATNG